MSGEVCMFDKFGFCKWETTGCNKVHLKENCLLEECDIRKCQKRHPRPCKFFTERGNCKYGGGCKFDHRPPKQIRSLVSRLDALEKENKRLQKVIGNQDLKIDKMSEKCNNSRSDDNVKGVDLLKKQIAQLIDANKKTTEVIKKIDKDLDGMNKFFQAHIDTLYDSLESLDSKVNPNSDTDEDGDEVELDEHSEELNKGSGNNFEERAQKFIEKSLEILEEMEGDVQKCRKNGKDVKEKHRLYCDRIIKEGSMMLSPQLSGKHQDCMYQANEIKNVLEKAEKEGTKFDKDDCLKTIDAFKSRFRNLSPLLC